MAVFNGWVLTVFSSFVIIEGGSESTRPAKLLLKGPLCFSSDRVVFGLAHFFCLQGQAAFCQIFWQ